MPTGRPVAYHEPMSLDSGRIAENLRGIRHRIADAAQRAGRHGDEVRLVAVTKTVGPQAARVLYDLGVRHFAENRVEGARQKVEALPGDAVWHCIGNLQRRKVREAVSLFARLDGVDRIALAEELQKRLAQCDAHKEVLLEVNVSGEASKHGFSLPELGVVLDSVRLMDRLRVVGLMTMAPFEAPEELLRKVFRGLREAADCHGLPVRSMGMTDDFEIAIEEGATEVRIGRALFA